MPVSASSDLYRLANFWGFTAFAISLGSSYFQVCGEGAVQGRGYLQAGQLLGLHRICHQLGELILPGVDGEGFGGRTVGVLEKVRKVGQCGSGIVYLSH